MSPTSALQTLRQQLSKLYDDSPRLRVLIDDVGLSAEHIALGGAIAEVWQNVLREAHRQEKVTAIVAYASADYPARAADLTVAYETYRQAVAAASSDRAATTLPDQQRETPMNADPNLLYDVFLSYSHQDATWVRGVLLPKLTENGLRVCIDVHDFVLGAPLITEIERAIVQSRKTLLVLTPDYLTSEWTEFETVLVATLDPAARERRLLPLIRKPTELPLRLRALTGLEFSGGGDETFLWQRLLNAFRPSPPPTPPVATVKPPVALERPLGSISAAARVRSTLTMAQRTLTILEEQAAGHTALSLPAHLRIELEEKRREVASLEAQLKALGG